MKKLLANKPWLIIVIVFVAFLAAWAHLIWMASSNAPEQIPLDATQKEPMD